MFWSRNTTRRPQLNRRKKTFKKKFLLLVPVFLIGIFYLIWNSSLLDIKHLELHQEYIDCATEQQIKESINAGGLNLLLLDTQLIRKNLSTKFLCIKKIDITKKYPNTVRVNVFGRVPVLKISTLSEQHATMFASLEAVLQEIASPSAQSSESAKLANILTNDFVVDQEGEVFSQSIEIDVPKILFLSDEIISVGKKLDKSMVENLLVLFDKLRIFNVDFKEVKVYSGGNILVEGNTTIVLNQKYDMQKQLASLQLILEKAKIENKVRSTSAGSEQISFIDVRFEKPVVRYVKKGR